MSTVSESIQGTKNKILLRLIIYKRCGVQPSTTIVKCCFKDFCRMKSMLQYTSNEGFDGPLSSCELAAKRDEMILQQWVACVHRDRLLNPTKAQIAFVIQKLGYDIDTLIQWMSRNINPLLGCVCGKYGELCLLSLSTIAVSMTTQTMLFEEMEKMEEENTVEEKMGRIKTIAKTGLVSVDTVERWMEIRKERRVVVENELEKDVVNGLRVQMILEFWFDAFECRGNDFVREKQIQQLMEKTLVSRASILEWIGRKLAKKEDELFDPKPMVVGNHRAELIAASFLNASLPTSRIPSLRKCVDKTIVGITDGNMSENSAEWKNGEWGSQSSMQSVNDLESRNEETTIVEPKVHDASIDAATISENVKIQNMANDMSLSDHKLKPKRMRLGSIEMLLPKELLEAIRKNLLKNQPEANTSSMEQTLVGTPEPTLTTTKPKLLKDERVKSRSGKGNLHGDHDVDTITTANAESVDPYKMRTDSFENFPVTHDNSNLPNGESSALIITNESAKKNHSPDQGLDPTILPAQTEEHKPRNMRAEQHNVKNKNTQDITLQPVKDTRISIDKTAVNFGTSKREKSVPTQPNKKRKRSNSTSKRTASMLPKAQNKAPQTASPAAGPVLLESTITNVSSNKELDNAKPNSTNENEASITAPSTSLPEKKIDLTQHLKGEPRLGDENLKNEQLELFDEAKVPEKFVELKTIFVSAPADSWLPTLDNVTFEPPVQNTNRLLRVYENARLELPLMHMNGKFSAVVRNVGSTKLRHAILCMFLKSKDYIQFLSDVSKHHQHSADTTLQSSSTSHDGLTVDTLTSEQYEALRMRSIRQLESERRQSTILSNNFSRTELRRVAKESGEHIPESPRSAALYDETSKLHHQRGRGRPIIKPTVHKRVKSVQRKTPVKKAKAKPPILKKSKPVAFKESDPVRRQKKMLRYLSSLWPDSTISPTCSVDVRDALGIEVFLAEDNPTMVTKPSTQTPSGTKTSNDLNTSNNMNTKTSSDPNIANNLDTKTGDTCHTIPDTAPTYKKDNWVQCDACKKWRRLPDHVDFQGLPSIWHCKLNDWDQHHNQCQDAEETPVNNDKLRIIDTSASINRQRIFTKKFSQRLRLLEKFANETKTQTPSVDRQFATCCLCFKKRPLLLTMDSSKVPNPFVCWMNRWDPLHASCHIPAQPPQAYGL